MFHTYILHSQKTERYYVGSCADLNERITRHNAGHSKATRAGIPWSLAHVEEFSTRAQAVAREREIKAKKSRKSIERIIQHAESLDTMRRPS